jgi:hypothetical protein
MRRLRDLNIYRDRTWERRFWDEKPGDLGGCFKVVRDGVELRIIAGVGDGWDHLSVSTSLPRCPTWSEMEFVKRMFFAPTEVAMQLHVPPSDHISVHPYCLHLWRPHDVEIPLPPKEMVA